MRHIIRETGSDVDVFVDTEKTIFFNLPVSWMRIEGDVIITTVRYPFKVVLNEYEDLSVCCDKIDEGV